MARKTEKTTNTKKKTPAKKSPAKKQSGGNGAIHRKQYLKSMSDIRRFFHRNSTPYFFVSATNFNLIGIDEWVSNFHYINYIDCFDGNHPNLFKPTEFPHEQFNSIEDINNYLLEHKETVDFIRSKGGGGKALFLFFDETTEAICKELGLEICFPSSKLRTQVDNKIETTRIAERAGVPCVPNMLLKVSSYQQLRKDTKKLGDHLVIQTAFGDSGHTTFFISNKEDFEKHADEIIAEKEVKVMKRIKCRGSALEACVTRHGTVAGPLMTELVGFPELTPYKGGWCGNEVIFDGFSEDVRAKTHRYTVDFGNELWKLGYRGYFELDFLRDIETGEVYLGELNPRITGASSMTNLAAFAHADAPLFLFHLLEWSDVDFELDVEDLNNRWNDPENIDVWSQMVIKHTSDDTQYVTQAPPSGIWQLDKNGNAQFLRVQTHRRTVQSDNQAFFLRIAKPGDYFYEGADLGILIMHGRLMTPKLNLSARAKKWITAIREQFSARPLRPVEVQKTQHMLEVGSFKML